MPLINIEQSKLSDLVVHEIDPSVGYARRVVNIADTEAEVPMGTIVYRAISAGATDQAANFTILSNVNQLVTTNEFAVVFGDGYGHKEVFTTGEDAGTPAVAYVRDEVILKDDLLLSVNNITRDSAGHKAMKALLEKQGIIVEVTYGA